MATFLVVLLRTGPEYDLSRPLEEQSGWDEHAAFMDGLVDDGFVVLGGPLADEVRTAHVVEAESEAAVRARFAEDPWSGSHLVVGSIDAWTIRLDARRRRKLDAATERIDARAVGLASRFTSFLRSSQAPQPQLEPAPDDVREAVVAAYYPAIVAAADSTRTRAQNAYAVAAAIATALVTAGALTGIDEHHWSVKVFGLAAVMGWIATALIFMLAIGGTVRTSIPGEPGLNDPELVDHVIRNARERAAILGSTIDKGWVSALVAAGLTVIAFLLGFAVSNPTQHDWHEARIALNKQGQATFAEACDNGLANKAIAGSLDLESLSRTYAVIELPAEACYRAGSPGIRVQIALPPNQILGYARSLKTH